MGCCFSSDRADGPPPAADLGIVTPDAVHLETAPGGATTASVQCPKVWVSHVIGAGGETIKKLKADSGQPLHYLL